MNSIERVLDGLDVVVDPLVVDDPRLGERPSASSRPIATVCYAPNGNGTVALTGGAVMQLSASGLTILPPRGNASRDGGRRKANCALHHASAGTRQSNRPVDGSLLVSGRIGATYLGGVSLFDLLREPIVQDLSPGDPIRRSFADLLEEIIASRPGWRAMAESLLRQCLILLLRRYAAEEGRRLSWLAVLQDVGLGRAVAAMRDRPEHGFTLRSLAAVAGMSRSVFAVRFSDALDESPMHFLKAIRLGRAAQLLTRTDLPVKTVAGRVGYSSRSSFTRAFLASHLASPAVFRHAARGVSSLVAPEEDATPQRPGGGRRRGLSHRGGPRRRSRRR